VRFSQLWFGIYQVFRVLPEYTVHTTGAICDYSNIMLTDDAGRTDEPLRLPDGGFGMVALDQRQSLRNLLADRGAPSDDKDIMSFKRTAATVLSRSASAILLDRELGLRDGVPPLAPGCALVLAADVFDQPPGQIVQSTDLDPGITADYAVELGAAGLKLLILWSPDGDQAQRADLVGRFLAVCREARLASVLEGVARPPAGRGWLSQEEHDDAILAAAAEFGPANPTIYKTEVPGLGRLPRADLVARARAITSTLTSPWVVLSSGVRPADFPAAVEAACAGGADGFLAGRAIWAQSLVAADPAADLATNAVTRLTALRDSVTAGRRR
jgi:sulfofructosephosphate aldolase